MCWRKITTTKLDLLSFVSPPPPLNFNNNDSYNNLFKLTLSFSKYTFEVIGGVDVFFVHVYQFHFEGTFHHFANQY